MATYKAPKRKNRRTELREDKVVTFYTQFLEFFEGNRNLVFGILGGIVLLIIMGFGYGIFKDRQEDQAQEALAGAVRLYEESNWQAALDGSDGVKGLLDVAGDFGSSKAGNLALYYAADAYFKLGDNESALKYFRQFDNGGDALGAGAYAGEAAILESNGDFSAAGDRYKDAAEAYNSEFTSARYLQNAGRNYEQAGAFDKARAVYQTIKEDFPDSAQASDVDMFMARVDLKENQG
ncbi:MAG: tetratricopeptide repeat protein [Bacteroidota bacterium]